MELLSLSKAFKNPSKFTYDFCSNFLQLILQVFIVQDMGHNMDHCIELTPDFLKVERRKVGKREDDV